ncbi:MAG: hypothetical protein WKF97_08355 [Chitinophagaceae bacterium]
MSNHPSGQTYNSGKPGDSQQIPPFNSHSKGTVTDYRTTSELRSAIKVFDWSFSEETGVHCAYQLAGIEIDFIATPEQMATQLEKQSYISRFEEIDGEIIVFYEAEYNYPDESGNHVQNCHEAEETLKEFMSTFSQYHWIGFLVTYEYLKSLRRIAAKAKEPYVKQLATSLAMTGSRA